MLAFVFCLLVTHVYSLYASGCLLSNLFLIYLLWVYPSKKKIFFLGVDNFVSFLTVTGASYFQWSYLFSINFNGFRVDQA